MSGPHRAEPASGLASARSAFQYAMAEPPPIFTLPSFAKRLAQHALFYTVLLAAAVSACLFVAAPLQATGLFLIGILVAVGISSLAASSGARLRRMLQGGIAATYALGAGMLFKVIAQLWHRF